MTYRVTKTYGHERGFSAAFRQHQAKGHCSRLHGYALAIGLTFDADTLLNHWVIDFGALGPVEAWLREMFDHTLLVARNDPEFAYLLGLADNDLARVQMVRATGCEAFAALIFIHVSGWLDDEGHSPRVRLAQVDVAEHGANRVSYVPALSDRGPL
jgi:6-pyruvoyltetrahydropterin/6-carboxytetrahydropterin synthase